MKLTGLILLLLGVSLLGAAYAWYDFVASLLIALLGLLFILTKEEQR